MKIIVIADNEMQDEFKQKGVPHGVNVIFSQNLSAAGSHADACFYLLPEDQLTKDISILQRLKKPVIANAVTATLKDLPGNFIRINAWPGFLQRSTVEICCSPNNTDTAKHILSCLSWAFKPVPDIEGMISARIIAMIVNEAYFLMGEKVSTEQEIDTAMKLGTNYPYGPFEWSQKIGLLNIYRLLQQLSRTDKRYSPSPLLTKEIL